MILSAICLVLYPIAIQYKRGGWYRLLTPLTLAVAALDILANYTEWWFAFGKPPEKAVTISKRIRWMIDNAPHESQREFARMVQVFLDAFEQDGRH